MKLRSAEKGKDTFLSLLERSVDLTLESKGLPYCACSIICTLQIL